MPLKLVYGTMCSHHRLQCCRGRLVHTQVRAIWFLLSLNATCMLLVRRYIFMRPVKSFHRESYNMEDEKGLNFTAV